MLTLLPVGANIVVAVVGDVKASEAMPMLEKYFSKVPGGPKPEDMTNMIVPIYGALERIPGSLFEASSDLGGSGWTTMRRVVLPLALPGLVAGSIFTFSLTLGDYITPPLVMNSQFIGNVIYSNQGVAGNLPFAAAFAVVPIVIMAIYLIIARRAGAFDSL